VEGVARARRVDRRDVDRVHVDRLLGCHQRRAVLAAGERRPSDAAVPQQRHRVGRSVVVEVRRQRHLADHQEVTGRDRTVDRLRFGAAVPQLGERPREIEGEPVDRARLAGREDGPRHRVGRVGGGGDRVRPREVLAVPRPRSQRGAGPPAGDDHPLAPRAEYHRVRRPLGAPAHAFDVDPAIAQVRQGGVTVVVVAQSGDDTRRAAQSGEGTGDVRRHAAEPRPLVADVRSAVRCWQVRQRVVAVDHRPTDGDDLGRPRLVTRPVYVDSVRAAALPSHAPRGPLAVYKSRPPGGSDTCGIRATTGRSPRAVRGPGRGAPRRSRPTSPTGSRGGRGRPAGAGSRDRR